MSSYRLPTGLLVVKTMRKWGVNTEWGSYLARAIHMLD